MVEMLVVVGAVVVCLILLKPTYRSVIELIESLLLARVCYYSGGSTHIRSTEVVKEHNHYYLRR